MPGEMKDTAEIRAGDIWWAAPDPAVGREQSGRRPILVISGKTYNAVVTTLALAVPITSKNRGWPNHIKISQTSGLGKPSYAMSEQVKAISRERLMKRAGVCSFQELEQVRQWVRDSLAD